jgi:penicillin-binding protein 1C
MQYPPPPPPKRRRRRLHPACSGCLLALLGSFGLFVCITIFVVAIVWTSLRNDLTNRISTKQKEWESQTFQTTYIYDRQGALLHEMIGEGRRTKIKLAEMPDYLIKATLAVEDNTFYENSGVDWVAVTRAGLQFFQVASGSSGGSTITQQLVRNIAFDYKYRQERSAQRKIEEIIMALILTREKSKDEILEMYLNQIYYGNLAYGIEAAAQTYFGKHAKDLSLPEAALLAGLPQAPAELDPLNPDPKVQEAVYARRKVVLDLMVEKGKISRDEADKALAVQLVYANPNVNLRFPHFTVYAEQELKSLLEGLNLPPEYLSTRGLKVYTTIDPRYQTLAENVARQQIAIIRDKNNATNAAVVILKPTTGEILAMLGSVDYNNVAIQGKVNVTISPRQPGSAIKPLTYAAAMESQGFSPASILWDVETHYRNGGQDYKPMNYDRRYHGPVRLRDALANSYNVPAVQTLNAVSVPYFLDFAQRLRISSLGRDASKYGLALTLGTGDVSLLELSQAYSVFANDGKIVSSTSILCIIDSENKVVYQYEGGCNGKGTQDDNTRNPNASAQPVLDPRIAFVISDILSDNVARSPMMGNNSPLRTDKIATSVKTGTTDDFRDNWTVGFTRNVVVGVWVGNTDSKPMVSTTGLTGAAPIWHDVIMGIYNDPSMVDTLKRAGNLVPDVPSPPGGLYKRQICNLAALRDPAANCPPGRSEWVFASQTVRPDQNGNLPPIPPNEIPAAPTQIPRNANGPILIDVEPGVVQTYVQRLDPGIAATLVQNNPGRRVPPPPLYCLVPNEVREQIPSATAQFFVRPPADKETEVYARIYAQGAGIPILPEHPCTPEMLIVNPQTVGVAAIITSPQPGETVTGTVQVSGTASWQPGQATYFKMEIVGPAFQNWTTFGQTHDVPVINGPLDSFGAAGLAPGTYKLRIIIVGVDGNYLHVGPETPINITGQ